MQAQSLTLETEGTHAELKITLPVNNFARKPPPSPRGTSSGAGEGEHMYESPSPHGNRKSSARSKGSQEDQRACLMMLSQQRLPVQSKWQNIRGGRGVGVGVPSTNIDLKAMPIYTLPTECDNFHVLKLKTSPRSSSSTPRHGTCSAPPPPCSLPNIRPESGVSASTVPSSKPQTEEDLSWTIHSPRVIPPAPPRNTPPPSHATNGLNNGPLLLSTNGSEAVDIVDIAGSNNTQRPRSRYLTHQGVAAQTVSPPHLFTNISTTLPQAIESYLDRELGLLESGDTAGVLSCHREALRMIGSAFPSYAGLIQRVVGCFDGAVRVGVTNGSTRGVDDGHEAAPKNEKDEEADTNVLVHQRKRGKSLPASNGGSLLLSGSCHFPPPNADMHGPCRAEADELREQIKELSEKLSSVQPEVAAQQRRGTATVASTKMKHAVERGKLETQLEAYAKRIEAFEAAQKEDLERMLTLIKTAKASECRVRVVEAEVRQHKSALEKMQRLERALRTSEKELRELRQTYSKTVPYDSFLTTKKELERMRDEKADESLMTRRLCARRSAELEMMTTKYSELERRYEALAAGSAGSSSSGSARPLTPRLVWKEALSTVPSVLERVVPFPSPPGPADAAEVLTEGHTSTRQVVDILVSRIRELEDVVARYENLFPLGEVVTMEPFREGKLGLYTAARASVSAFTAGKMSTALTEGEDVPQSPQLLNNVSPTTLMPSPTLVLERSASSLAPQVSLLRAARASTTSSTTNGHGARSAFQNTTRTINNTNNTNTSVSAGAIMGSSMVLAFGNNPTVPPFLRAWGVVFRAHFNLTLTRQLIVRLFDSSVRHSVDWKDHRVRIAYEIHSFMPDLAKSLPSLQGPGAATVAIASLSSAAGAIARQQQRIARGGKAGLPSLFNQLLQSSTPLPSSPAAMNNNNGGGSSATSATVSGAASGIDTSALGYSLWLAAQEYYDKCPLCAWFVRCLEGSMPPHIIFGAIDAYKGVREEVACIGEEMGRAVVRRTALMESLGGVLSHKSVAELEQLRDALGEESSVDITSILSIAHPFACMLIMHECNASMALHYRVVEGYVMAAQTREGAASHAHGGGDVGIGGESHDTPSDGTFVSNLKGAMIVKEGPSPTARGVSGDDPSTPRVPPSPTNSPSMPLKHFAFHDSGAGSSRAELDSLVITPEAIRSVLLSLEPGCSEPDLLIATRYEPSQNTHMYKGQQQQGTLLLNDSRSSYTHLIGGGSGSGDALPLRVAIENLTALGLRRCSRPREAPSAAAPNLLRVGGGSRRQSVVISLTTNANTHHPIGGPNASAAAGSSSSSSLALNPKALLAASESTAGFGDRSRGATPTSMSLAIGKANATTNQQHGGAGGLLSLGTQRAGGSPQRMSFSATSVSGQGGVSNYSNTALLGPSSSRGTTNVAGGLTAGSGIDQQRQSSSSLTGVAAAMQALATTTRPRSDSPRAATARSVSSASVSSPKHTSVSAKQTTSPVGKRKGT